MTNADKIALVEFEKKSSLIDIYSKYMWVISNVDIDAAKNLRLTNIKKHWKLTGQI